MTRWVATVVYRSEALGLLDVEYDFTEIDELSSIIENGPDWNSIERIEMRLANVDETCKVGSQGGACGSVVKRPPPRCEHCDQETLRL